MTDIYLHLVRPQQVADDQNSDKRAGDATGGIAAVRDHSDRATIIHGGKMIAGASWVRSWRASAYRRPPSGELKTGAAGRNGVAELPKFLPYCC